MALLDDFVAYVQRELFKRPFSNDDPQQESIMVRRGGGPRQLAGLALSDLQVIGQQNGQAVGINISDLGTLGAVVPERKLIFTQGIAAITWTIPHSYASRNVEVYVVDSSNQRVEADSIQATNDSTVVISFTQAQAGKAFLRWYD
jgi:hypothetical protein